MRGNQGESKENKKKVNENKEKCLLKKKRSKDVERQRITLINLRINSSYVYEIDK